MISQLLISLIIAFWIGAIAIISIQNIELISLNFLLFESIKIPVGILLAMSLGVGMIIGAIAPIFFQIPQPKSRKKSLRNEVEEEDPLENWEEEEDS